MSEQPSRIVIYCDGTGNSEYQQGNRLTNVSRIKSYVKATTSDNTRQSTFYVRGIGTEGFLTDKLHQANAKGIEDRIKEGYTIIRDNYSHDNGDQIILLGFSRGAFIMRCVADMVGRIGVLTKAADRLADHLVDLVFEKWKASNGSLYPLHDPDLVQVDFEDTPNNGDEQVAALEVLPSLDVDRNDKDALFTFLLRHSAYLRRDVHIKVCALLDTVAAINTPLSGIQPIRVPGEFAFVNSELGNEIENAIHALSLHERRRPFLPLVWRISDTGETLINKSRRLQQCWFVGYHSDIGGGRKFQGLSHISLAWMIARLQPFLEFEVANFSNPLPTKSSWKFHEEPDSGESSIVRPKIIGSDSMTPIFRIAGKKHRKPRRHFWTTTAFEYLKEPNVNTGNSKETIHWTVSVITGVKWYPSCKALTSAFPGVGSIANCRCEQDNKRHRRHWTLQLKSPAIPNYRVCEETALEADPNQGVDRWLELRLLLKWLSSELKALQRDSKEGDPDPRTCMVEVADAIIRQFQGTVRGI
ncbi:uncharacterized protein PV07_06234 [Cladophialophora immunda]|uniref:T6SS Phospholipase effector Tle1-like catalytic domain-containing protein n=1 Tax=Cladophialophora immunda TaxID=569365 RepID=A0A0D2AYZ5_9EURO|nr:uncharacterized protein PV07_06234 [Cladophialophora immunda]KIW30492.1 hypothetical protein PV07_06234 [Cladophialophora immunda]